ncbi:MAG: RICIN domain-containing protein [Verrucomicrobiota bacterium]|nr:RICIN domain-containing protein [Verrucomicrobiota bacterium]
MKRKVTTTILNCGLWLAAVLGILACNSAKATLYWTADTSKGTSVFQTLDKSPSTATITVVNDPLGQYGSVYQYYLPDEPPGYGKERCESKGSTGFTFASGHDYYIGWRAMWKPMPINPGWVALFQLHGYGPSGQPAPLVLRCINGDGNISLQNGVTGGNPDFWHVPFKLGVWQTFVIHVKISPDPSVGYVEVWYNGVQQTLAGGVTRLYCQTVDATSGSYDAVKWGCYRSGAMDGTGSADAYMSGGKIGSTYADVDPGGGGGGCSPTPIVPYLQVNGGAWQQTDTATITSGSSVTFGPQPTTGGSWNWSGPNGFSSTSRQVTVNNITSSGNYTATYINSCGDSSSDTFVITVSGGSPDFSITAGPSSQTVTAGSGTSYTTSIGSINNFSGSVSLSVSGLPSGASAGFNPTSVSGSGNSTLSVSTASSTPAGTYTLTITGTSGSLTHSTSVSLTVNPPSGGGIDTTATYEIQNEASGLVLNNQGSTTDGTAITQWSPVTSANLDWKFITTSGGYYQINSVKSGLDAVVQSASTAAGAKIIQWSFGSSGDDQWQPQANSDGSYTFVNLHSGLVLEDPGSSTSTSTQMDQWTSTGGSNQKWKLLKQ